MRRRRPPRGAPPPPSASPPPSRSRTGRSLAALFGLNWWVPFRWLPHGILGAASLLLGAAIIVEILAGGTRLANSDTIVASYTAATAGNAIAGYLIAPRAGKRNEAIFRHAAIFQACLVYYVYRFHVEALPLPHLRLFDVVCSAGILLGIGLFARDALVSLPVGIAAPLLFGCVALALLAGYPVQLALGGDEWWQCVQRAYPEQRLGLSAYVYTSASWSFGAILFGATLFNRKLVSEIAFGICFAGLVMATLFSTVLMQEVWIPVVSTQKLVIPCPDPGPGHFIHHFAKAVDTSALAQTVIAWIRSMSASPP